MDYLIFSMRGATEEAGTVGDEVEVVEAAKWSRTYGSKCTYTCIYTPKQALSATTKSRQRRLRRGHVRTQFLYTNTHTYTDIVFFSRCQRDAPTDAIYIYIDCDATTGNWSWRRAREYICFYRYIHIRRHGYVTDIHRYTFQDLAPEK